METATAGFARTLLFATDTGKESSVNEIKQEIAAAAARIADAVALIRNDGAVNADADSSSAVTRFCRDAIVNDNTETATHYRAPASAATPDTPTADDIAATLYPSNALQNRQEQKTGNIENKLDEIIRVLKNRIPESVSFSEY